MINSSAAYQAAITGDSRQILLRAIIDIIDPDITYGTVSASGAAPVSQPAQIHDKIFDLAPYATLERNRWLLNGTFRIFPDNNNVSAQIGFVGGVLSGDDGTFETPVWVEESFQNVSILQACSIYFPNGEYDGIPVTFTVEIKQGGTTYFSKNFTNNSERQIDLDGFTVNNPDAIRVTVSKWSLPGRRLRIPEILPGVYEEWDNNIIATFNVTQQANFSCLALPYGTCTLSMDNLDRRFEPRNKNGVFRSIEDRQGIDISIGVRLPDRTTDYMPIGKFYQYSGGWRTGDNGLTMQWNLVDIIGLLADRQYMSTATLPTTLSGWVASIVSQLGTNFADLYIVDTNYANLAVTANSAEDVSGKSCGEILRMACMATGTWPRADAESGKLAIEPFWNQGNKMTLDNLVNYPIIKANNDLAAIIFTLADGSDTQYVVSGNSTSSSNTVQVNNPFIHTQESALTAARLILSTYGGNQLETTGRGNPSSEIGDVDTVWLNESSATTGRRMFQTFAFSDGVMRDCQSTLLQADGSFLFENREVITESGTWTAPAGATQLRIIVVDGGDGGQAGTDGTWSSAGMDGADGSGGHVWAGTISINPQQQFSVSIGAGGAPGQPGGTTTFGQYSGANGQLFPLGYTDIAAGDSYARTGVKQPISGTGDGGAGGNGGVRGNQHDVVDSEGWVTETIVDNYPGDGAPGAPGASGCVVVYWDKEDA